MNWLNIIKNDKSKVDDFIALYTKEYEEAKNDIKITGNLIGVAQKMPMLFEKRYAQFEDINLLIF